ncbi:c-type cytochrome [Bradyrhizobium sp.]|uniref:c-type cytochrome n=1 Tax=Bradyrhizobium sp. TaxID=376 RepID=UPI002D4AE50D|nr:c-type cytochrome [Bradyrhizobium sp.]HZR77382.1 c-type cytochrome [Bradyrhizobium sp.]
MHFRSSLLGAIIFALTNLSTTTEAQQKAAAPAESQTFKAKFDYCKTCHGIQGQGFRGSYPMPRLAGQQPEYLVNQLQAFIERRRNNPVMFNVAHVLSPSMEKALAEQFNGLNPKPLDGTSPKADVTEGKRIYLEGIQKSDVPPCASCHGDDAKGRDAFPRLAGQLHDYVYKKLTNWDKERGQDKSNPDNSAIMQPIAHNLSEAQIKAVAAYVSQLE